MYGQQTNQGAAKVISLQTFSHEKHVDKWQNTLMPRCDGVSEMQGILYLCVSTK